MASAPTDLYTLSLHDALPICDIDHRPGQHDAVEPALALMRRAEEHCGPHRVPEREQWRRAVRQHDLLHERFEITVVLRSEEHTSELQSLAYLVCRLLLEKKKI